MKKRVLSGAVAGVLTLSLATAPALAAAPVETEDIATVLAALDIMTGNESGDLMLDRTVTRAEFTKLTMAASPMGKGVGPSTLVSPYPDVPNTHWSAPYVEAAVNAGYVNGYLDGTFHPDEQITLSMGVTMVLRLLGYSDGDFTGVWPTGQLALYRELDLDQGITAGADTALTRRDAMHLFYNLLTAPTRSGGIYLSTLGGSLTATGEIDRVAIVNAAMEGPIVATGSWGDKLGTNLNVAKVYRNGKLSTAGAIQSNDVLYWSDSMHTVWAYGDKVTGRYQAVSPSALSPTSVTVAGKTYALETAQAAYDLSNLGQYQVGDTVTLLLGRSGGVAAVAQSVQGSGTLYGVVEQVFDDQLTDTAGGSYYAKSISLRATDGNSYTYPVAAKDSYTAGDLVQVTAANGDVAVKRLSRSSLSGKVNTAGTKLGNVAFAGDVEILDTDGDGNAVKIYPSRLAGMTLASGDIRFYRKNAAGEIDRLILDDATGDLAFYGVITSSSEVDLGMDKMAGYYRFDVAGQSYTYQLSTGVLNQSVGPVKIEGSLLSPSKFTRLEKVKLQSLDAQTATATDGTSWLVWEDVSVYELENGTYRLSNLERVRTGYSLTGYYDTTTANGGRIRVVVAVQSDN